MTQLELFERVLGTLESLQVDYMITGSIGAMLYGEPRLTNDMDVVVHLAADRAASLAASFEGNEFYLPPKEVIQEEIARRGQFNLIHAQSGAKVDFIILKDTEFAREEFSRRRKVAFSERLDSVSATPEDIVISKLLSYRAGGSEKHLRDIRGILAVSGAELDPAYLERWVRRLALTREWSRAQPGSGPT